jgi:hypothetical protein
VQERYESKARLGCRVRPHQSREGELEKEEHKTTTAITSAQSAGIWGKRKKLMNAFDIYFYLKLLLIIF